MVRQSRHRKLLSKHARGRGGHHCHNVVHPPIRYATAGKLPYLHATHISAHFSPRDPKYNPPAPLGKNLFVPKVDSALPGGMDLLRIQDEEDLRSLPSGVWGIKEPTSQYRDAPRTRGMYRVSTFRSISIYECVC
jgi:hypothetical protein